MVKQIGKVLQDLGATPEDVQELAGAAVELIFGDFKLGSSEPATRILSTLFKDDEGKEACIISLSGVVLDACRGSLADEDLSSFLEDEHSLSSGGASQAVAAVIKKHRSRIAEALEAVARSTSLPQVKSVGWRLDVNVGKNDTSRSVREPFFHINLTSKVASNQAEAPLQETEQTYFVCNMEEMEDLVSTLKDACHSLQRNEAVHK